MERSPSIHEKNGILDFSFILKEGIGRERIGTEEKEMIISFYLKKNRLRKVFIKNFNLIGLEEMGWERTGRDRTGMERYFSSPNKNKKEVINHARGICYRS